MSRLFCELPLRVQCCWFIISDRGLSMEMRTNQFQILTDINLAWKLMTDVYDSDIRKYISAFI
jgi:hypothetical protein